MASVKTTGILCPQCQQIKPRLITAVRAAAKEGKPIYCSRECALIVRRKNLSIEEKKSLKKAYDAIHRSENRSRIKASKAAYFQRTYDPVQAAVERKKNMPRHLEYCRQPEYKAYKQEYDRKYRAEKYFADFGDCHLVLQDLEKEIDSRATAYEIRMANGTLNKVQARRRQYAQVQFEGAVLRARKR